MRLRKSSLLIIGLSALVLSSMTATAETVTDGTGDVYFGVGSAYEVATDDKPNVDITEITFNEGDVTTTMTMTVNGVIEDSEYVQYWITFEVSEEASYSCSYTDGIVMGMATTGESGSMEVSASVSGNTLTVEFESVNIAADGGVLYGYAATWSEELETTGEMWMDYAPGTYAPWYGDDGNGDGDGDGDVDGEDGDGDGDGDGTTTPPSGTPGFEAIAVIAALGVAFIVLKRRK